MRHPIYILWATPRSTSTAFEWMMRMRGDMQCLHEPFGEAWYRGEDAKAPRLTADSPRTPGLTFNSVYQKIKDMAESGPVFIKDMPPFTEGNWDDDFLDTFVHSFLIRDPAKVLYSLQRSWEISGNLEGFERNEIGFDEQRRLFDLLCQREGKAPVVIDSDDLLQDPEALVEAYCDAIGIPFIREALSWKPGERKEVLWYDSNSSIWHDTLKKSDGLKPQAVRHVDIEELPAKLQRLYETFLPHYEHLRNHRLVMAGER